MLLELFRCKVIKLYLKAYKNREINDSICKKIYCKVIFDGKNSLSYAENATDLISAFCMICDTN